jgi:uncharacterized protein (UPF0548 family)
MAMRLRVLRHPTAAEVRDEVMSRQLSYPEVGASLEARLPAGYHHIRAAVQIGTGEQTFASGCDALRAWAAHTHLHIVLTPARPPLEVGAVVVAEVPTGPVTVLAPCRIVATLEEEDRFGFAYGTLPGHPERGEESFVVIRGADGVVRFEVAAFSRPSTLFIKMGGPIPRWFQQRATQGYLEGVRRFVAANSAR